MKLLILITFLALLKIGISPSKTPRKILKQVTDNRGLTSVVFVEGKDTLGLDYLTRAEYSKLFN